jgi:hypothetical protein
MIRKSLFTSLVAVSGLLCTVGAHRSSAANILQNGGFETADATTSTGAADWTSVIGAAPGTVGSASLVVDPTNAHSGNNYLQISATGLDMVGGANVQAINNTPLGSVTPNLTYTLTLYAKGAFQPGDVANFALNFLDSSGNVIGGSGVSTGNFASIGSGYTLYTESAMAPANASAAQANLSLTSGAITGTGPGTLSIDDVAISAPGGATPEPATLAILGIGGVALLRRKRTA